MKKKFLSLTSSFFLLAASTTSVLAASGDIATIEDLKVIFGNIVRSFITLSGMALFILLLVGGFKYITSGGDPKALESAQKTITYAIGGLVVILLSFLILVLIKTITGVDVTQFNIILN